MGQPSLPTSPVQPARRSSRCSYVAHVAPGPAHLNLCSPASSPAQPIPHTRPIVGLFQLQLQLVARIAGPLAPAPAHMASTPSASPYRVKVQPPSFPSMSPPRAPGLVPPFKPIVEDLQVITICGHVFHELCLQQWFEYSARTKRYTCPVCKQNWKEKDAGQLYFQSVEDSADPSLTQRPINQCEEDPVVLRRKVKRLEVTALGLRSTFDLQGKELKEPKEELCLCKDEAKKEAVLKNEALKQQASMKQRPHMKSEAFDKSTMERLRLQDRNMALAKELAAFKLVSDLDLNEDEVLKLSTLGGGHEIGVLHLQDAGADIRELNLDLGSIFLHQSDVLLVLTTLLLLLDRRHDAPRGSERADHVLVSHGEQVALLHGQLTSFSMNWTVSS